MASSRAQGRAPCRVRPRSASACRGVRVGGAEALLRVGTESGRDFPGPLWTWGAGTGGAALPPPPGLCASVGECSAHYEGPHARLPMGAVAVGAAPAQPSGPPKPQQEGRHPGPFRQGSPFQAPTSYLTAHHCPVLPVGNNSQPGPPCSACWGAGGRGGTQLCPAFVLRGGQRKPQPGRQQERPAGGALTPTTCQSPQTESRLHL